MLWAPIWNGERVVMAVPCSSVQIGPGASWQLGASHPSPLRVVALWLVALMGEGERERRERDTCISAPWLSLSSDDRKSRRRCPAQAVPQLRPVHACMHICMYVCMYVCIYIFVYICMAYTCMWRTRIPIGLARCVVPRHPLSVRYGPVRVP
jgi:hypothetical protein